jgi:hypothetical protein
MSSVRMCDSCHAIFSENDPDWTTVAGSRRQRDPRTGEIRNVNLALDECGKCTQKRLGPAEPIVPPVEGRYDERYTRQLEREVIDNG